MLKYSRNTASTGGQAPGNKKKKQQQTFQNSTLEDNSGQAMLPKSFYVNDRSDETSNLVNLFVLESNTEVAQAAEFD